MKYTVDTTSKTIEIENATSEEIIKLASEFESYTFSTKKQNYSSALTIPCGTSNADFGQYNTFNTNKDVPFTLTN